MNVCVSGVGNLLEVSWSFLQSYVQILTGCFHGQNQYYFVLVKIIVSWNPGEQLLNLNSLIQQNMENFYIFDNGYIYYVN